MLGERRGPSKDVPKTQLPPNPTLPPLPSPLGLLPDPNLQKRKRKGKEIEEGEFSPLKDPKQQKTNRERQMKTLMESREDFMGAEVRRPQRTWSFRLELDGAPIPWDASVQDFQGGIWVMLPKPLSSHFFCPKIGCLQVLQAA